MDARGKCTLFHGSQMHLLRLLFLLLLFLHLSISAQAQEEDKSLSYLASGSASAKFSWDGFTMTMDGTHQEIGFRQDRSPFTNLFTGLNFISQDYSGEDTDGSGKGVAWLSARYLDVRVN